MARNRLNIEFTKQDGTASNFWTPVPKEWDDMSEEAQAEWVSRAAYRRHRGAQKARVVKRV